MNQETSSGDCWPVGIGLRGAGGVKFILLIVPPNPPIRPRWFDECDRVLYRLSEFLSSGVDKTIFVPEGEKDVDNLTAIGLLATTNPGGAGKWSPVYSASLVGRDVVFLPDNDEAGRAHAEQVASQLSIRSSRLAGQTISPIRLSYDQKLWMVTRQ